MFVFSSANRTEPDACFISLYVTQTGTAMSHYLFPPDRQNLTGFVVFSSDKNMSATGITLDTDDD